MLYPVVLGPLWLSFRPADSTEGSSKGIRRLVQLKTQLLEGFGSMSSRLHMSSVTTTAWSIDGCRQ